MIDKILYSFFYVSVCCLIASIGALVCYVQMQSVDFSALEHQNYAKPSIVLDDQSVEWARFSFDKRKSVTYDQLPNHLIQAFIAAEDHAFFSHWGISLKGIVRSLLVNIYHGRIVQGASTITQQLVKLLYTDCSRTFHRKIKDQLLAVLVEYNYTKEQIMQTYLNNVCFGCGIYGVDAASHRFWSKSSSELSVDEAAALAGIVNYPSHYCPLTFPLSCKKRRNVVLKKMKKMGVITEELYVQSIDKELSIIDLQEDRIAPHVYEEIRVFLEKRIGKHELYTGGYVIKTTLNLAMQREAECSFVEHVSTLKESLMPSIEGALLSIEVKTGQIKALVGGYDFKQSKFNRALQAKRQMASIFKTLIYVGAIQEGYTFAHTEIDEPIEIPLSKDTSWKPRNSSRNYLGQMTLAKALSHSNNIVTIKTLLSIGPEKIVDLAKRCRIKQHLQPYPSLALGCVDATLPEVVGMFNILANNGVYIEPHLIVWVKDQWGNKIYKKEPETERIISSRVSGQVAKILSIGLERARRRNPSHWIDCEAFGKTGTTDDSRTSWFIGSTPELTTAIYIGCDDNKLLCNVYGVTTAFLIWKRMYCSISSTKKKFSFDSSLRLSWINPVTGLPSSKDVKNAFEILI